MVVYVYFTYILQGSIEMHLRCGWTYNNYMIANCPRSVPVKDFENWSVIGEDLSKSKVACFYWPIP